MGVDWEVHSRRSRSHSQTANTNYFYCCLNPVHPPSEVCSHWFLKKKNLHAVYAKCKSVHTSWGFSKVFLQTNSNQLLLRYAAGVFNYPACTADLFMQFSLKRNKTTKTLWDTFACSWNVLRVQGEQAGGEAGLWSHCGSNLDFRTSGLNVATAGEGAADCAGIAVFRTSSVGFVISPGNFCSNENLQLQNSKRR